ncbi:MAG: hypothetical protein IJZ18_03820 [Mailhella sp.]|nr:hypothetical protein [Mailhella sp.]
MKIERDPRLAAQLKRHEGLRLHTYRCPAGRLTIGYGHNLSDNPVWGLQKGDRISRAAAERLLENDIYSTGRQLDAALPWWRMPGSGVSDFPRQAVLLNMAFQLGVAGLCAFKKALGAVHAGAFGEAARNMLDSKWARRDSPARARELARQMHTGQWQSGTWEDFGKGNFDENFFDKSNSQKSTKSGPAKSAAHDSDSGPTAPADATWDWLTRDIPDWIRGGGGSGGRSSGNTSCLAGAV